MCHVVNISISRDLFTAVISCQVVTAGSRVCVPYFS